MGKQRQQHQQTQASSSSSSSLKIKAAHLVSDLTTVILNPISDNINKSSVIEDNSEPNRNPPSEESPEDSIEGPDTSSFSAFLYSLLSPTESSSNLNFNEANENAALDDVTKKESSGKKSLISRGKQSLGRAISQAAKFSGYRQASTKGNTTAVDEENSSKFLRDDGILMQTISESIPPDSLPEASEKSLLLSEKTRSALYVSLPSVAHGRKWVLLYSTWRHGISLSTLYRRSMLCPGPSLLVVGDRRGAIFGGYVEAPLRPSLKKRYQGTNSTFVFTNTSGLPVIFRPTGMNRYFTLCSTDYLALGGGSHFALYLDSELLSGSSSASETYGNPCLAHTEDFEVKEIELWGFVYTSKYEEMVSLLRLEAPGICRW
ncbi:Oxidation resistance protein 1 [Heracleum sosnowskyi]|uniref:Oxidation resistance protein 1 n=1 Tax=Heracleum sosnowskyi TaxID=360622 RepID=A0AAD8N0W3_9APIA|nr:Oxidation resistance protein 1 [Heracleum sosnowskyi]